MSDEHVRRDRFRDFLVEAELKPNSQLVSDEKALRIRRVLSCTTSESPRFRFYIRSKGFALIDLPVLGLKDVLCVPAPKVRNYVSVGVYYRNLASTNNVGHSFLSLQTASNL